MRKLILFITFSIFSTIAMAGITTYQFTSTKWASKINGTTCDGKKDGWINEKEASSYNAGYIDAEKRVYSRGVSVKTGTSGAGARSIKSFTNVRRITFNFCQNSSNGEGIIYAQVNGNAYDSIIVRRPKQTGSGVYMRDSSIYITTPQSGSVRFWVSCSENAININSISIRAEEGGSTPFTTDTYQLVTSTKQLKDSDQVIVGVHKSDADYIMGYFDEDVSKNNIHAIKGQYSDNRQEVGHNDEAIYTLHKGYTSIGEEAWYFQDEIRYQEAFLVANGGQSKNRLSVWNHLYDEDTYGDYGYWDIQVLETGKATIKNLGRSKGIYMQYNASNTPTLFACYAEESQTPVCLYRCVKAIGDVQDIVVPLVNFGDQVIREEEYNSSCRIMVNANKLTEDIHVSLADGSAFQLDTNKIDRDGDYLTIYCHATQSGHYRDTLILCANGLRKEALVILNLEEEKTIQEAKSNKDFDMTYLGKVVVTKKYDNYIFIRDTTGSMLIYDNGDGQGGRYGEGLENGDVLYNIAGRYQNYFGVPELSLTTGFDVAPKKETCNPEVVTHLDSSDVCRYVHICDVNIQNDQITLDGTDIKVENKFQISLITDYNLNMDAIVYWSHSELVLWPTKQQMPTALKETEASDVVSQKVFKNGTLYILKDKHYFTVQGQRIE